MDPSALTMALPNPRPTSSVYSDDMPSMPTMSQLIHEVSEEAKDQEYETIASYRRENQALEEEIALHRKAWNGTIMLANKVIETVTMIKKSVVTVDINLEDAQREWLAFWGIYKESPGSHPPWI